MPLPNIYVGTPLPFLVSSIFEFHSNFLHYQLFESSIKIWKAIHSAHQQVFSASPHTLSWSCQLCQVVCCCPRDVRITIYECACGVSVKHLVKLFRSDRLLCHISFLHLQQEEKYVIVASCCFCHRRSKLCHCRCHYHQLRQKCSGLRLLTLGFCSTQLT
jgi:hypothetical protein